MAEDAYDYLLFGTVFTSAGKPEGHRVAGLDGAARGVPRARRFRSSRSAAWTRRGCRCLEESGAAGFAAVGMFM